MPINSTWNYTVTDATLFNCYYNTSDAEDFIFVTCNETELQTNWSSAGDKTIFYYSESFFAI